MSRRLLPPSPIAHRLSRVSLVVDQAHYERLIVGAVSKARVSVWIGTANVKDLHVEAPIGTAARAKGRFISIVEVLRDLTRAGVEVRILHGARPSRSFIASLGARGRSSAAIALRHCPRVHLKMIAVDGELLYLGSANFTGAGLGAKAEGRRNFEMGLVTDDDVLLDAAQGRFDSIWSGKDCAGCRLRSVCPKPLDAKPLKGNAKALAPSSQVKTTSTGPRTQAAKARAPSRPAKPAKTAKLAKTAKPAKSSALKGEAPRARGRRRGPSTSSCPMP